MELRVISSSSRDSEVPATRDDALGLRIFAIAELLAFRQQLIKV